MLTLDEVYDKLVDLFKRLRGGEIFFDSDIEDVLISDDKLITSEPCYVYAVIALASSAAYSQFSFRNGQTAAGASKLELTGAAYLTIPVVLKYPIYFDKGLFCEFVTAGSYVFIQYKLASGKVAAES
jgi:hypothetical protein